MSESDNGGINSKKKDLSDQLRQISQKIDKEIVELRKQNLDGRQSQGPRTKREPDSGRMSMTTRPKADSTFVSSGRREEPLEPSRRLADYKESLMHRFPKIHLGPFNAGCLFMANPKQLLAKIASYLNQNNRRFEEVDGFTLKLSEQ